MDLIEVGKIRIIRGLITPESSLLAEYKLERDDASPHESHEWDLVRVPDTDTYQIKIRLVRPEGRQYLTSVDSHYNLNLVPSDVRSEAQMWRFVPVPDTDTYQIKVARGGAACPRHVYLSCPAEGYFADLWREDDGSGRQQWQLPEKFRHAAKTPLVGITLLPTALYPDDAATLAVSIANKSKAEMLSVRVELDPDSLGGVLRATEGTTREVSSPIPGEGKADVEFGLIGANTGETTVKANVAYSFRSPFGHAYEYKRVVTSSPVRVHPIHIASMNVGPLAVRLGAASKLLVSITSISDATIEAARVELDEDSLGDLLFAADGTVRQVSNSIPAWGKASVEFRLVGVNPGQTAVGATVTCRCRLQSGRIIESRTTTVSQPMRIRTPVARAYTTRGHLDLNASSTIGVRLENNAAVTLTDVSVNLNEASLEDEDLKVAVLVLAEPEKGTLRSLAETLEPGQSATASFAVKAVAAGKVRPQLGLTYKVDFPDSIPDEDEYKTLALSVP